MNKEIVINTVKSIRNGSMFKLVYQTEMPVKAAFKKAGVKVVKVTSVVTRTGVNYEHISYVIKKKATGEIVDSTSTNNYSWLVANKVAYNSNTDCTYLRIAPVKNGTSHSHYLVTKDGVTTKLDRLDDETLSMLNKLSNNYVAPVKLIKTENIISIGKVVA